MWNLSRASKFYWRRLLPPQTPRYLLDNEILLHFHVVVWGQGQFATTKRFAGGALSTKFAPSSFVQPAHDTSWQNKIRWNEIKQHYLIPTHLVTTILFDRFLEQATSQNSMLVNSTFQMLSRLPSCGGGAIRAMSGYARTPKPPYYAVIFTSERTSNTQARWKQEMSFVFFCVLVE